MLKSDEFRKLLLKCTAEELKRVADYIKLLQDAHAAGISNEMLETVPAKDE